MGKKHISVPQPGGQEQGYYQRAGQLLNAAGTGLSEGAYQQNSLAPYLYNLAGLDVQYDDSNQQTYQQDVAAQDAAQKQLTQFQGTKGTPAARKAAIAAIQQATGTNLKGAKLRQYLQNVIKTKGIGAQQAANAPLRIKSITEDPASAAERQREQQLLATEQTDLQKSLSSNAQDVLDADPALKQALAEQTAQEQQAQVNQFGSLAAAQGGTIGAVQNAALGAQQAAAISNARRENIGLYQGLQTQQNQQNNANSAQKAQMAALPGALQQDSAMRFGQLAGGYSGLIAGKAAQRQMQFQANSFNQTQPGIGEKILSGIGSLLQPFKQSGS